MSDQTGILPKWFSNWGIVLAKAQLEHLYTFWTIPILIFSPVQIIMGHPLISMILYLCILDKPTYMLVSFLGSRDFSTSDFKRRSKKGFSTPCKRATRLSSPEKKAYINVCVTNKMFCFNFWTLLNSFFYISLLRWLEKKFNKDESSLLFRLRSKKMLRNQWNRRIVHFSHFSMENCS